MSRIIVLVVLSIQVLHGQSVTTRMGARSAGLATASFTLADEMSLHNNVAGISWNHAPSVSFAYDLVPVLPGANRTSACSIIPLGWGTVGFGAFRFGDEVYSEQLVTFGYSHRIASASLGGKVNLVQYRASGFETHNAVTVDFAGLVKITPQWSVGAGISNLSQATIATEQMLPVRLVASLGWQDNGGLLVATEVEKELASAARVKFGVEIPLYRKFFVRTGFATSPITLTSGSGVRSGKLSLDFCMAYTEVPGFSYQASASYRWKKEPTP